MNKSIAEKFKFIFENRDKFKFNTVHDCGIKSNKTYVVLADLHIPFEDKTVLSVVFNYINELAKNKSLHGIVLLGDVLDMYKVSHYIKKPLFSSLADEIDAGYQFLKKLREMYPDVEIIYKEGNHEDRFNKYVLENAAEIYYLVDNLIEDKLKLKELNIKYVRAIFKIGKLYFIHGHEFSGSGSGKNAVSKYFYNYVLDNFVIGHYHIIDSKVFKSLSGDMYLGSSVGWLGGVLEYSLYNSYEHGFGVINFNRDGTFIFENKKVINNIVY